VDETLQQKWSTRVVGILNTARTFTATLHPSMLTSSAVNLTPLNTKPSAVPGCTVVMGVGGGGGAIVIPPARLPSFYSALTRAPADENPRTTRYRGICDGILIPKPGSTKKQKKTTVSITIMGHVLVLYGIVKMLWDNLYHPWGPTLRDLCQYNRDLADATRSASENKPNEQAREWAVRRRQERLLADNLARGAEHARAASEFVVWSGILQNTTPQMQVQAFTETPATRMKTMIDFGSAATPLEVAPSSGGAVLSVDDFRPLNPDTTSLPPVVTETQKYSIDMPTNLAQTFADDTVVLKLEMRGEYFWVDFFDTTDTKPEQCWRR